jgi:hypothetical protein
LVQENSVETAGGREITTRAPAGGNVRNMDAWAIVEQRVTNVLPKGWIAAQSAWTGGASERQPEE